MTKITSYSIDRTKTFRKSVVIFKHEGNVSYPIMYLQKPKNLSHEDFEWFLNNMQISINQN